MRIDTIVECPVHDSFRVRQVAGMFDVPLEAKCHARFSVELPDLAALSKNRRLLGCQL